MKRTMIFAAALLMTACGGDKAEETAATAEEKPLVLSAQDVATAQISNLAGGAVLTGSLQPGWFITISAQVP